MSNGASYCSFHLKGQGEDLGASQMYTPPVEGDRVSFGDGDDYKVVSRTFVMQDGRIRITVVPADDV